MQVAEAAKGKGATQGRQNAKANDKAKQRQNQD
jgi:hypothetical protein